ncbi:avidin-like [Hemitrygon akajei]|uniref:avidin-like n=1 Tax=Hemitrygon akajei TaxID=2704970 RepID=UPI003BFA2769
MQGGLLCPALLLALAVVGASGDSPAWNLAGCWTNQLGSTADIKMDDSGILRGTYKSKVSSVGKQVQGDLVGYQLNSDQPTFGFVVKWTTESVRGSVTVWTGQMFDINACQTLNAMWLLRRKSSADNNWGATRTGLDVFRRCDEKCGSAHRDGALGG